MDKSIVDILEKPFSPKDIKTRKGSFGKDLSYVQIHHVLGRLNKAFNGDYSLEVLTPLDKAIIDGHVIVHVRLSVELADGKVVSRDGIGGKAIVNKDYTSIYKSAISDAIKKAATTFGIALDLYGADETEEDEKDIPAEKVAEREPEKDRPIQESQKTAIRSIMKSKKLEEAKYFAEKKITSLDSLSENQAKNLIVELQKVK